MITHSVIVKALNFIIFSILIINLNNVLASNINYSTVYLNHGNDDIEQRENGSINVDSGDIELVIDKKKPQIIGLRYQLGLTSENLINNAFIQFTTDEKSIGKSSLIIHIENSDDTEAFTIKKNSVSNRQLLDIKVSWTPDVWDKVNESTEKQQTKNIAELINRIISRKNWKPCNHITFIIKGSGTRTAYAYEGGKKKSAALEIEYSGKNLKKCIPEKYISLNHKPKKRVVQPIPKHSTKLNPEKTDYIRKRNSTFIIKWNKPIKLESEEKIKKSMIKSYKLYYRKKLEKSSRYILIKNKTRHKFTHLKPGIYYFSLSVISKNNIEGEKSPPISLRVLK